MIGSYDTVVYIFTGSVVQWFSGSVGGLNMTFSGAQVHILVEFYALSI